MARSKGVSEMKYGCGFKGLPASGGAEGDQGSAFKVYNQALRNLNTGGSHLISKYYSRSDRSVIRS